MEPKRRIIPIFVPHVGCPNDCVFCNQRKISGTLVPPTAERVKRDIVTALENIAGASAELAFYGGSFTAIPQEDQIDLLSAVSPFLLSGQVSKIRVSTRPDCIDKYRIDLLKSFGVETVELGTQSLDDEVLRLSGRGHTAEDTENAVRLLRENSMNFILQMMTGLPGDSREKSIRTAERIVSLAPNGVRIYPTVIIKDTALYDMWQSGEYEEHTVEQAVEWCADIVTIFRENNIPIIRLGLNPTDDLSAGEAVAGAYHPALGELVYSRIYLRKARALLSGAEGKAVVIGVAKGRTSLMIGQKRVNINVLMNEFGLSRVKVKEIDIKDGEIQLLEVEK